MPGGSALLGSTRSPPAVTITTAVLRGLEDHSRHAVAYWRRADQRGRHHPYHRQPAVRRAARGHQQTTALFGPVTSGSCSWAPTAWSTCWATPPSCWLSTRCAASCSLLSPNNHAGVMILGKSASSPPPAVGPYLSTATWVAAISTRPGRSSNNLPAPLTLGQGAWLLANAGTPSSPPSPTSTCSSRRCWARACVRFAVGLSTCAVIISQARTTRLLAGLRSQCLDLMPHMQVFYPAEQPRVSSISPW